MYPSWSRQGLQWKAHSRCALIGVPCIRKQGLPYRQLIITGGEDLEWKARPGALKKKLYGRRLNCLKPGYCFGNAERRHGVKRDAREPGTKPGLLAQNANARSGGHLQEYFKVLTLTQPQRLLHELQESCASSYLQYLI